MQNNSKDISKLILKTAGKTTIIMVVLLLLVSSLFLLLAPSAAGNFLCVLGWNDLSASITYNAAKESDEFEDYYQAFTRATNTQNYKLIYNIANDLLNHKDYYSKIANYNLKPEDINFGNLRYDAKDFVYNNYIKSGVIVNNGQSDTLWKKAREYDSYRYTPVSALSGYARAFVSDTKMPLGDTLERLKAIYKGLFSSEYGDFSAWSLYSSMQGDKNNGYQNIVMDALSIIEARKISGDIKTYWVEQAEKQGLKI